MIPVENSGDVGVRAIVSVDEIGSVMEVLQGESTEMSTNWNRRYRDNMDKLKTGNIYNVAEVVRNLMRTDKKKKLSTGEKKLLSNAKQILISELIHVKGIDRKSAEAIIDSAV